MGKERCRGRCRRNCRGSVGMQVVGFLVACLKDEDMRGWRGNQLWRADLALKQLVVEVQELWGYGWQAGGA